MRLTKKLCFVMGIVMPTILISWNASLPMSESGTLAVIAITGTLSIIAVARPVTRLVAPGPLVATTMPGLPVALA